jgi:lactate dehydrogenase-like 2-hydroxyacid dehydrogenase
MSLKKRENGKIVVIDSGYDSYVYEEELFKNAGYHFEIFPGGRHDHAGKKEFAKDASGILVRWTEINDGLLNHPRLITTGHYAWYSTNSAIDLQKRAADNLLSLLNGDIPNDCLNP